MKKQRLVYGRPVTDAAINAALLGNDTPLDERDWVILRAVALIARGGTAAEPEYWRLRDWVLKKYGMGGLRQACAKIYGRMK